MSQAAAFELIGSETGVVPPTHDSAAAEHALEDLPGVPKAQNLWLALLIAVIAVLGYILLDELVYVLLDFWLMESLGFESVFWTNFNMAATLFVVTFVLFAGAIAAPALLHVVLPRWRGIVVLSAIVAGLIAGYDLADEYLDFLLIGGKPFGKADPVFGNDVGFYVYNLPAYWDVIAASAWLGTLALASSVLCAYLSRPAGTGEAGLSLTRLLTFIAAISTPFTRVAVAFLGLVAIVALWYSRYDLLIRNNEDSMIFSGAEYLDVVGMFSTLNYINLTVIVVFGITAVAVFLLSALHRQTMGAQRPARELKFGGWVLFGLIALDFAFRGVVMARDALVVRPNEPYVQLDFIKNHIDATMSAYQLDGVEVISLRPLGEEDPPADPDQLLEGPTLMNAPLWPGWVAHLEALPDPQHQLRILQTNGDTRIYGPVLDIIQQQQKLRMYYDFLNVHTVRYQIDGETRIFFSAVREMPTTGPEPWLYLWGQRFGTYTHGQGLVIAPVSAMTSEGEPIYVSKDIPPIAAYPELETPNPAIYYGEGFHMDDLSTLAFSNLHNVGELDYPKDEALVLSTFEAAEHGGVPMDSLLKRLVIAWHSGYFFEILMSDLIEPETDVHYYRAPLDRLDRIAPFLHFDTNIYAVAIDGKITWMINGMTISDRYPYSVHKPLGDKASRRNIYQRPIDLINYVADTVKITLNAHSGEVKLYKIADEPVIETWAEVYPGLLTPGLEMPDGVRAQITYPSQMFHTQFDDIFKRYHMREPLVFFSAEDLWDDGDEVLGPILDEGEAITFSIEPYHWIATTDGTSPLPYSNNGTQFAMSMAFTPEKAVNLRAIPVVFQDGDDYGRLFSLQIPKGYYYPGPEQADSAFEQEPDISQQITWWNRMGSEVILGHTVPLVIGHEILYIQPLFIQSKQNAFSQLKRVGVVYRGLARMDDTLEEAVRAAVRDLHRPSAYARATATSEAHE